MSPLPFDHFRLLAPVYDRVFSGLDPRHLRELIAPFPEGWLLDLGGGTGRVMEALGCEPGRVVVADVSAEMLEQAREKGLATVLTAAEALPFPDGAFARIVMVDAFHHLEDQDRAAVEMWRVLAPGGWAIIEEPDIARWPVKLIALGEKLLLMRSHFRRSAWIARLFAGMGGQTEVHRDGTNYWVVVRK